MKKSLEIEEEGNNLKKIKSPNSIDNENLPDPETWTPFTQSNWKKDYRRALGDLNHPRTKFISLQALQTSLKAAGSLRGAARYLNVSPETFRKYARYYIDPETGKSYHELYKRKGIKKGHQIYFGSKSGSGKKPRVTKYLQDLIEGKVPVWGFSHNRIKNQLIATGLLKEECKMCGFHERRLTDGKLPLILHHKNGVKEDFHLENIELLCYNCSFLFAESPITEKQVEEMEDFTVLEEGDPITWEISDFQKETLQHAGLLETGRRGKPEYASEEFRRRAKTLEARRKAYLRMQKGKKKEQISEEEEGPSLDLEIPQKSLPVNTPLDWTKFEEFVRGVEKKKK